MRNYNTSELITFDAAGKKSRYMHAKGIPVPGVTTILKVIAKEALINWAAKCASDYWQAKLQDVKPGGFLDLATWHKEAKNAHRGISKDAADKGTEVHRYAEARLKGQTLPPLTSDEAKHGAEAFEKWFADHSVEFGASERVIFSQASWFCGTCDFVGKIDGERCVLDFKTSSAIYPEMKFQLAAYQSALEEEWGDRMDCRWIVRFDKKTGEVETKRLPQKDFDRDFNAFLSALSLHRTLKQIEEESL